MNVQALNNPLTLAPVESKPSLRVVETGPQRSSNATPTEREPDRVDLSDQARSANAAKGRDGEPLPEEDQREVEKLQARDQEVRTHEQAHVAAAGSLYRGGPTYQYRTGPDGNRYAVGGSVQIDTGKESTPEETITKAQQIRRAALAPAEPSSTDQRVAAKASRMEAEARSELAAERSEAEDSAGIGATAESPRESSSTEAGSSSLEIDAFLGRRLDVAA